MARRYLSYWFMFIVAVSMFLCVRNFTTIFSLKPEFLPRISEPEVKISNSNCTGVDLSYVPDTVTDIKTLQLVQVIFRHGERTPLFQFPTDPNRDHDYGVKGFGQLTQKGQSRSIELGKYFRKRYDGYLNTIYALDEIFLQSSPADRTLMTASLCLAGLYPALPSSPFNFQAIPVHGVSRAFDNKLGFYQRCPKHEELYREYMQSPYMKNFDKTNSKIYRYMATSSGLNITSYEALYELTDTLFVQQDSGLELPEWTIGIYPSLTELASQLEFITATATDEMKRLYIGPLFTELVKNMEIRLGRETWTAEEAEIFRMVKMFMYSTHDTTMSNLLHALDVYEGDQPGYGSALMIELHSPEGEPGSDSMIKLFYKKNQNETAQEIQFPNCGPECGLESFKQLYQNLIISPQQWIQECSI